MFELKHELEFWIDCKQILEVKSIQFDLFQKKTGKKKKKIIVMVGKSKKTYSPLLGMYFVEAKNIQLSYD